MRYSCYLAFLTINLRLFSYLCKYETRRISEWRMGKIVPNNVIRLFRETEESSVFRFRMTGNGC